MSNRTTPPRGCDAQRCGTVDGQVPLAFVFECIRTAAHRIENVRRCAGSLDASEILLLRRPDGIPHCFDGAVNHHFHINVRRCVENVPFLTQHTKPPKHQAMARSRTNLRICSRTSERFAQETFGCSRLSVSCIHAVCSADVAPLVPNFGLQTVYGSCELPRLLVQHPQPFAGMPRLASGRWMCDLPSTDRRSFQMYTGVANTTSRSFSVGCFRRRSSSNHNNCMYTAAP